jgi:hypothetical protein
VLRIPATLVIYAAVVLAALLAQEFGGGRRAQLLAAGAVAVSPGFLATGHLLATSTIDPLVWIAVTYLLVRWVRTRSDRLLLVAGIITAVGLQAKFLIVAFWVVAIVAVSFCGPRELPRRRALWAGAAIAMLATIPTLVWQSRNGWPQLEMGRVIAGESVYAGGMLGFLPLGFFAAGLLIGSVLGVLGLVRLLRTPEHRFLGVTVLGVALLFMITGGRPYYVAGVLPLLWAAGAARVEQVRPAAWWRWIPTWPVYAVTAGALLLGNVLPIQPVSIHADQPLQIGNFQRDEIGWPAMVADVQAAHRALPPDVARDAVVVTGDYWSYSAVQKFAPELRSFSLHRGAAWFGTPPETPRRSSAHSAPGPGSGSWTTTSASRTSRRAPRSTCWKGAGCRGRSCGSRPAACERSGRGERGDEVLGAPEQRRHRDRVHVVVVLRDLPVADADDTERTEAVRAARAVRVAVVLDLDDDHFRVVGVPHDHVDALDLEQRPPGGRGAVVLADGVAALELAWRPGRSEGVAQDAVDGEEVAEDHAFPGDHPADVLDDLARAAAHVILPGSKPRIGTVTPFRRYGTHAPVSKRNG